MAIEILMPALSPTMEEGTLAKWLVKEGERVKAGDILAEIETDKAVMEFEAVEEGLIKQLLVLDGTEEIKINSPIAIIELEPESELESTTSKIKSNQPKNLHTKDNEKVCSIFLYNLSQDEHLQIFCRRQE